MVHLFVYFFLFLSSSSTVTQRYIHRIKNPIFLSSELGRANWIHVHNVRENGITFLFVNGTRCFYTETIAKKRDNNTWIDSEWIHLACLEHGANVAQKNISHAAPPISIISKEGEKEEDLYGQPEKFKTKILLKKSPLERMTGRYEGYKRYAFPYVWVYTENKQDTRYEVKYDPRVTLDTLYIHNSEITKFFSVNVTREGPKKEILFTSVVISGSNFPSLALLSCKGEEKKDQAQGPEDDPIFTAEEKLIKLQGYFPLAVSDNILLYGKVFEPQDNILSRFFYRMRCKPQKTCAVTIYKTKIIQDDGAVCDPTKGTVVAKEVMLSYSMARKGAVSKEGAVFFDDHEVMHIIYKGKAYTIVPSSQKETLCVDAPYIVEEKETMYLIWATRTGIIYCLNLNQLKDQKIPIDTVPKMRVSYMLGSPPCITACTYDTHTKALYYVTEEEKIVDIIKTKYYNPFLVQIPLEMIIKNAV